MKIPLSHIKKNVTGNRDGNWVKPIPKSLSNKVSIKEKIFWNLKLGETIHNLSRGRKKTKLTK